MSDIKRWKLMADWVMPPQGGPAQPLTVVIGPRPEPGERIEVVRASDYEEAVEALRTARKDLTNPDNGKPLPSTLAARMRIDDALNNLGERTDG